MLRPTAFLSGILSMLLGCAHAPCLCDHPIGEWLEGRNLSIIQRLELSFEDVKYDGFTIEGKVVLEAIEPIDLPRVLDWRTLGISHIWNCETGSEVPERVHVDYGALDDRPGFVRLAPFEKFSRTVRLPAFSSYYTPAGGPNCIGFMLVYAPDGWFVGANTATFIGRVSKNATKSANPGKKVE